MVISATDLNFRTWPRVAWTAIANAIYHGPVDRGAGGASSASTGDVKQRRLRRCATRASSHAWSLVPLCGDK